MRILFFITVLGSIFYNNLIAQSIDFDQFTTTSTYGSPLEITEEGETFVFTATGGEAGFQFKSMAAYPGELLMGDEAGGTTRITITHKDGDTFDFTSLDVTILGFNAENWIVRGYLSNSEVSGSPQTFTLVINDVYRTKSINLTQVDKITLEENPVNAGGFEIWIDKFVVANVLPVELVSFEGFNTEEGVMLRWETATEVNNYGFQVQRTKDKGQSEGTSTPLSASWETLGFVHGNGTTNSPKYYEFTDSELPNVDEVSYRLKQIDNDGTFAYSKVVTVDLTNITSLDDEVVYEFSLEQNYPNPFNPTTTIKFTVPSNLKDETSKTKLIVYNILGREIKTLLNKQHQPGEYEIKFDASNLPSGVYFYKFNTGEFSKSRKMLLLK